jgi:hypothetical protein
MFCKSYTYLAQNPSNHDWKSIEHAQTQGLKDHQGYLKEETVYQKNQH